jgi:hypothetical protein
MSKYGAKFAEDVRIRYDQTGNIAERFLFDLKTAGKIKHWLETCGVAACACGVEAVGGRWKVLIPELHQKALYGYDDALWLYMYSTVGRSRLPHVKDGDMEHEFIENLAFAINVLSTAKATVKYFKSTDDMIIGMLKSLQSGASLALSYLTDYNSGHYQTVVQRRDKQGVFIAYDSWAANKHCKKGGVLEEYDDEFYHARCKDRLRFIEIKG